MADTSHLGEQLARMKLTQVEASRLLGIDSRSFRRYLQQTDTRGYRPPPPPVLRLLAVLEHIPGAREWLASRID